MKLRSLAVLAAAGATAIGVTASAAQATAVAGGARPAQVITPTQSTSPVPKSDYHWEVTDASYDKDVTETSKTKVVIADYYTPGCGGCVEVKPHLIKKADTDRSWFLAFIDCNKYRKRCGNIRAYPAFEAFVDGKSVGIFNRKEFEIKDMTDWIDEMLKKWPGGGGKPAPAPLPGQPGAPAPAPTAPAPPVPTTTAPAPAQPTPEPGWPTWTSSKPRR